MIVEERLIGTITPYHKNPHHRRRCLRRYCHLNQGVWLSPAHCRRRTRRHHRWTWTLLGCIELGLEKVPVHVPLGWSPAKIKAYRIADNKTAELSTWNYDLLPLELADLQTMNYDLGLLGFDQVELAELLVPGLRNGLCDPDEVPAPPEQAITRPGDLWLLGDHRLLPRRFRQGCRRGSLGRWSTDAPGQYRSAVQREVRAQVQQRDCHRPLLIREDTSSEDGWRTATREEAADPANITPSGFAGFQHLLRT